MLNSYSENASEALKAPKTKQGTFKSLNTSTSMLVSGHNQAQIEKNLFKSKHSGLKLLPNALGVNASV